MSGSDLPSGGSAEEELSYSVYRGHRSYECAACGRRVPPSSNGLVYVLEDWDGSRGRRVEPICFERAREEAGLPPMPASERNTVSSPSSGSPPFHPASDLLARPCGGLTAEQVAILRSAGRFPPDSTADEIAFGLEVARRIGLDVWLGQVKFLRFDPSDKIHPFVGIDGMRAVAERSGQYDGREIDVELAKGPDGREKPVKAVCRVHRKDWSRPLVEEVRFDEAVGRRKDGQPTRPWAEMPVTMLRKAAEERALRAAFPLQLAEVYGEQEAPTEGKG
jgi:phage recombination protein Bet